MRISRFSYYGDFVVYPLLVGTLGVAAVYQEPLENIGTWLMCFVIGVAIWTFAEYILHRYLLHHVPYVKDMHDAHHENEKALIGTPTWLSVLLTVVIVLLPLYLMTDFVVMSGLAGGMMLGYLWYVTVHHMVHHWNAEPDTYAYRLKRRHALHHYFDDHGNFGVTSGFWDRVFGTNISVKSARQAVRGS